MKLFVFLFPEENYAKVQERSVREELDESFDISNVFDTIINKKYIEKGYKFAIATTKDKDIYGISIEPDYIVRSKTNYKDFYKRNLEEIMKDYKDMAFRLNPSSYEKIVVGGYHIGDCVDKFTSAINSISNNASIDYEISNQFINNLFIIDSHENIVSYNYDYVYYNDIKETRSLK